MKRLITGIQSTGTGNIHLGNYIGAIRQVVNLQYEYETFVFVADLHSLNSVHNADQLRENVMTIAKAYLACGLDPEKATLFCQSAVPAHSELAVILAPSMSHGALERAHAYKDAVAKGKSVNAGLFYYPVLMAADILLYNADLVPVGADQQQHIEMTREVAERFNHTYGASLTVPEGHILGSTADMLKGIDGRKMSKSYDNVIGLFDTPEVIRAKCAKIVTDSKRPEEPKDPAEDTIFSIYKHVASENEVHELEQRYRNGGIGYKEAKDMLAEAIIAFTEPIRIKKAELDADESIVQRILVEGSQRAAAVANPNLEIVKKAVGLA